MPPIVIVVLYVHLNYGLLVALTHIPALISEFRSQLRITAAPLEQSCRIRSNLGLHPDKLLLLEAVLGRSVSVLLDRGSLLNIFQFKLIGHAVAAPDQVPAVLLCFLGHLPDAQPAYVVMTAVRHQHVIEVPEAHRATVFEVLRLFTIEVVNAL